MADLLALAARVEAATGADRELDCQIWWSIMQNYGNFELAAMIVPDYSQWLAPYYTASLDVAMMLVPDNHSWAVGSCGENDGPWACVTSNDFGSGCPDFTGSAATEPLVLTAASLRALAAVARHNIDAEGV